MRRLRVSKRRTAVLAAAVALIFCASGAWGRGFREQVSQGNRAFSDGDYAAARKAYEEAGLSRPESPFLYFNRALVDFRADDLAAAKEGFEEAAMRTRNIEVEARAHYNLGNVAAAEAERQADSNLQKAIAAYESAVASYQRALELDPQMDDAAHNTEVLRIRLKDLLDKLRDQPQPDTEQLEEIVKRLQELIGAQNGHVDGTRAYLAAAAGDAGGPAQLEGMAGAQRKTQAASQRLSEDIGELIASMAQPSPSPGQPPGQPPVNPNDPDNPLHSARNLIGDSTTDQAIAAAQLEKEQAAPALENQESAYNLLRRALDELTDEEQQSGQSEQEQAEAARSPEESEEGDEQAEDILQEEEDNRKRRMESRGNRYAGVDRDW